MKTLAEGTAIIIDDDESQYRGSWIVRLTSTRVILELRYQGGTHIYEPDFDVIAAAGYDCYARAVLARLVSELQSAESEPLDLFGTFG